MIDGKDSESKTLAWTQQNSLVAKSKPGLPGIQYGCLLLYHLAASWLWPEKAGVVGQKP